MKNLMKMIFATACVDAAIAKQNTIVNDDLIDKIAIIESNYNYEAKGDNGKALGAWQIHKSAWDDACDYAKFKDLNKWNWHFWDTTKKDYKESAFSPEISRSVVRYYLMLLEARMINGNHKVTPTGLYMAYNMGYHGASVYGFSHTAIFLDKKRKSILARANYILSR